MIQNLFEIETFCNTNLFIFIFDQFSADLVKRELWNKQTNSEPKLLNDILHVLP